LIEYTQASAIPARTRGANVTSADAIVSFRQAGRIETLLIEWKYTEAYGEPIANKTRPGAAHTPNETRLQRYNNIAFAPDGPIRADLGLELKDFFWEPFYQCLRQQILALQMQKAKEGGAERVRVLHISPSGNLALHKVTAPELREIEGRKFEDAFDAFRAVLVDPDAFISRSTEQVFGALLSELGAGDPWAGYLIDRYGEICSSSRSGDARRHGAQPPSP
jgi:hypothetical protein